MPTTLAILSDIHYAPPPNRPAARITSIATSATGLRLLIHLYRRFYWLRYPLSQNYLLDHFLEQAGPSNPIT